MINFDDVIKEKAKEGNPNWPHIPDHPCRVLITRVSALGQELIMQSNMLKTRY